MSLESVVRPCQRHYSSVLDAAMFPAAPPFVVPPPTTLFAQPPTAGAAAAHKMGAPPLASTHALSASAPAYVPIGSVPSARRAPPVPLRASAAAAKTNICLSTTYHRRDHAVERLPDCYTASLVLHPASAFHSTVRPTNRVSQNCCFPHHAARSGVRVCEVDRCVLVLNMPTCAHRLQIKT